MSKVVDNFLKYIAFDTQSAEDAASVPSTEKQFALAKLLVEQLKALGVKDVSMSEHWLRIWHHSGYGGDRLSGGGLPGPYGHLSGFFRREHPSPADPEL